MRGEVCCLFADVGLVGKFGFFGIILAGWSALQHLIWMRYFFCLRFAAYIQIMQSKFGFCGVDFKSAQIDDGSFIVAALFVKDALNLK